MDRDLDTVIERIAKFHARPLPPEEGWYGVGAVFRRLAGLPAEFPMHLQVHHGPHIEEGPLAFYDNSPLPVIVCRKALEKIHARRPGKVAFAAGTAHVWYRRLNDIQPTEDAIGTLAFPCHSSHHIEAVFDHGSYADLLVGLPDYLQPVTVSLYWIDLLKGCHRPYLERGLPVISSGHMADPYFLSEFYKNIRRYRYTTGNDVGTHTVLSIEMGIPYFHSGPTPRYRDLTGNDPDFNYGVACGDGVVDIGRDRRPMVSELCRLLPDPDGPIAISADLQAFVSYLHGTDEPLDRGALRRLIVEAYLTATPAARVAVENVWNDEDLQRHLGLSRLAPDAPATHAEAASN